VQIDTFDINFGDGGLEVREELHKKLEQLAAQFPQMRWAWGE